MQSFHATLWFFSPHQISLELIRPYIPSNMFFFFFYFIVPKQTSLVAQMVKRPSTMREIWVRSLGQEDTLEKEMATHSSTITWKILWMEDPDRLQSTGLQRVGHN